MAAIFTLPAPIAEPTRRLTVKVNGTTLTERKAVSWQDIGSGVGNGTFSLLNDDTQNSICTIGALVTFELDGDPVFRWFIENINKTQQSEGEEAEQVTVYSGRATASLLEQVIVYPSTGIYEVPAGQFVAGLRVATKPYSDERHLGWMEPGFDASAWGSAVEVLSPAGPFRPEGFPDPAAEWIWFEAASGGEHPTGDSSYFRYTFTPGGAVFAVKIFFAALEEVELYLDGVLIARTDPALDTDVGQVARSVTVEVNGANAHTLAARVTHLVSGLAGFLCTIYEHDSATVVARTSSAWDAVDAATQPGMTPGAVVNQLVAEAIARGAIPSVTFSFNVTDDSASNTWPPITGDFSVRIGDTLLDVVQQLGESWVEWAMEVGGGGQLLAMWIAPGIDIPGGGVGTGRGGASGVTFAEGVNCTEIRHEVTG